MSETRNLQWLLLSEIYTDKNFNTRHETHFHESSDPDTPDTTIASLAISIEEHGQDTPVIVRKRSNLSKPYMLVSGHRRLAAYEKIARQFDARKSPMRVHSPHWDPHNPTIWAEILELSDDEALLLNLRENTARSELSAADLAHGVKRLLDLYIKDRGNMEGSKHQIARSLGKSPNYIARLIEIMTQLDPKITGHWRTSAKPVSVHHMHELVTKYPEHLRFDQYRKFCSGIGLMGTSKKKASDALSLAFFKLESRARELGRLHELGFIDASHCEWGSRELLKELIKDKNALTSIQNRDWLRLTQSGREAFEAGRHQIARLAKEPAHETNDSDLN